MLKLYLKLLLIFFLSYNNLYAQDGSLVVKVKLSPVGSFEIKSESIEGKGQVKNDAYIAKELKVSVESLKTGISLRDKHLKEKLEQEKYPYIIVKNIKAKNGSGEAIIVIRNINKKIDFTYKVLSSKKIVQGKFNLDLKDFNFTGINYKGVGVRDNIEITVDIPYENSN